MEASLGTSSATRLLSFIKDQTRAAARSRGQQDSKRAAALPIALDLNSSAQTFDRPLRNREPQTVTAFGARPRSIDSIEPLEDFLLMLACDSRSFIHDRDTDSGGCLRRSNGDPRPLRG